MHIARIDVIFICHQLWTAAQARRVLRTRRPWKQRALLMSKKSFWMLPWRHRWQAPACPKARMFKVLAEIMETNSNGRRSETNVSRPNKVFSPCILYTVISVSESPWGFLLALATTSGWNVHIYNTPIQTCVCLCFLRPLWAEESETKLGRNKLPNNLGLWMTWRWWIWKQVK